MSEVKAPFLDLLPTNLLILDVSWKQNKSLSTRPHTEKLLFCTKKKSFELMTWSRKVSKVYVACLDVWQILGMVYPNKASARLFKLKSTCSQVSLKEVSTPLTSLQKQFK